MKQRLFQSLSIVFLLALSAFGQEGDRLYNIRREGVLTGTLRCYWDGSGVVTGTVRNLEGMVLLQDRLDKSFSVLQRAEHEETRVAGNFGKGEIRLSRSENGRTETRVLSAAGRPLFFYAQAVHQLFPLKKRFPKRIGGYLPFQSVNPFSMTLAQGGVEYKGLRLVRTTGGDVVARYYLVGVEDEGINLYVDHEGIIFHMEMPFQKTSFELVDYHPEPFPDSAPEKSAPEDRPSVSLEGMTLSLPDGTSRPLLLGVPESRAPAPACVLLDASDGILKPLAERLFARGIVTLLYSLPLGGENRIEQVTSAAVRHLRLRRMVDPSRVFLMANGVASKAALEAAASDSNVAAVVLLSPSPFGTRVEEVLYRIRAPLLILQGGADDPGAVKRSEDLAHLARQAGNGAVTRLVLAGLDGELMPASQVKGRARLADPERRLGPELFEALSGWLVENGLAR